MGQRPIIKMGKLKRVNILSFQIGQRPILIDKALAGRFIILFRSFQIQILKIETKIRQR